MQGQRFALRLRLRRPARVWAWLAGAAILWGSSLVWAAPSYDDVPGCIEGSLPSNDPRYPAAQLIVTCLPPPEAPVSWNGVLIVAVHGYVEPGEPLALPAPDGGFDVARTLLDLGFAFAASSFHKNGYAVEQGGDDINALVRHFNTTLAPADKVLLLGVSQGALIATMLIERHPQTYAGGLALCGPLGGANAEIDYLADFRVVFDYFFPQVFGFGAAGVPPDAPLNWAGYAALIRDALTADPRSAEQLFRVTGVPRASDDLESTIDAAVRLLRYTVFGFNDLVEVAGGNPYANRERVYAGSEDDVALNRGVERIAPDPGAREYLVQHYRPTGRLTRPLVTLHTRRDPVVPFEHQLLYARAAAEAGAADQFIGLPVNRHGHCNFRTGEVLGAVALLARGADISLSAALRNYLRNIAPLLE